MLFEGAELGVLLLNGAEEGLLDETEVGVPLGELVGEGPTVVGLAPLESDGLLLGLVDEAELGLVPLLFEEGVELGLVALVVEEGVDKGLALGLDPFEEGDGFALGLGALPFDEGVDEGLTLGLGPFKGDGFTLGLELAALPLDEGVEEGLLLGLKLGLVPLPLDEGDGLLLGLLPFPLDGEGND